MSGFLVCGAPFLAVGLRSRLSTCLIIPMRRIISLLMGRYELNKMTSLLMCGFIAQLVEHRTGIAEVTGSNPVEALIFFFFQASSFQLLQLENSLRGSFFTFIYDRSSNI